MFVQKLYNWSRLKCVFYRKINESAPFTLDEYDTVWEKPSYTPWDFDTYKDFSIGNEQDPTCQLPQFWWENGTELTITTEDRKSTRLNSSH